MACFNCSFKVMMGAFWIIVKQQQRNKVLDCLLEQNMVGYHGYELGH